VAYLGELSPGERQGWARMGTVLDGKAATAAQQLSLFEGDGQGKAVPETAEIRLNGVRVEGSRDFGDVFLGLTLWKMLGLGDLLDKEIPRGTADVPWGHMACLLTLARFLEPRSELFVEEHWYRKTALPDLLGIPVDLVTDSRLYRTLDHLLPLKERIEAHLKTRIGELFSPDFDLLLYDVTSTYFEGQALANPQAQRGYSRDHRADCKQVCIGLVATADGFPMAYEVFAGNRSDVTTLEDVVEAMETKYGKARRIWVMDRGIVSEENLAFLRERDGRYVVGTPRPQLRKFEQALLDRGWSEVEPGIEVKVVPSPEGKEAFVLCRSADRREKEKAMHGRFRVRIETALGKIENRLQHAKKRANPRALERQIGRLLGRNSRAAGAFHVEVSEAPERPSGLRIAWSVVREWETWSGLSEGCYLLRTNLLDRSPEQLWRTYVQLTDVEEVFRAEKSDLHVRPIWHHKEGRVQAHILFSFLAYALWKLLQTWMEKSGLGRSARTLLEELRGIKANEVILPTSTGKEIRLSCVTRPQAPLRALLQRMGMVLPERTGRPSWVPAPENNQVEGSNVV
jgi:transposase